MDTKNKTMLDLFNKCPPIITQSGNLGFAGAYPPTWEQVLLQYHGYHRYMQKASKLQSCKKDAVKLVVKDLQEWWGKTGITVKSWQATEKMILRDLEEYNVRKKKQSRTTNAETKKINYFLSQMRQTCWVVQPDFEKRLAVAQAAEKQDQRDREDWLYLEGIRGENRTATLGSRDIKLAKRRKRKFLDEQAEEARRAIHCVNAVPDTNVSEDSNGGGSADSDPQLYTVPLPASAPKSKKLEGVPEAACLIADKYAISNRAVTELAAAFRIAGGSDLNKYNLSVNTTGRRRQSVRLEKAGDIVKWQLGDSTYKMYALHWDGKLVKSLTHVGKDVERVAVILTGTDGQEVLLSIVGMEGSVTAENEATKIIQVCMEVSKPIVQCRLSIIQYI